MRTTRRRSRRRLKVALELSELRVRLLQHINRRVHTLLLTRAALKRVKPFGAHEACGRLAEGARGTIAFNGLGEGG